MEIEEAKIKATEIKEEQKKLQRIEWVDVAKGLGLLCVILGHFRLSFLSSWVYTFHIPLFFFLSGFVFSGRKYSFKKYLIKKSKTLLIPYFILGMGIFVVWCFIYWAQGRPGMDYLEMFWNFIKQEHFWTIWFLACLFMVELLYYWIDKASVRVPWLSTLISCILCGLGFLWYRLGGKGIPWNLDIMLVAQFFFHMGYLLKSTKKLSAFCFEGKIWKKLLLFLACLIVNIGAGIACIRISGQSLDMSVGIYGNEILTMISAFAGIFMVCILANILPWQVFKYLGKNTMLIFAWHSRIIMVLMDYVYIALHIFQKGDLISTIGSSAITFVVIFVVLVPLTELIKRSKMKFIIGR